MSVWLRLWVKTDAPGAMHRGRYVEVQGGPWPLTRAQLDEARRLFKAEWDAANASEDALAGIAQSPQTTARDILSKVAPQLSMFDRGMVAFAISAPKIRVTEETL
jgi:hypothetical protein